MKFDDTVWSRWAEWIDVIREDMSRIRNDAAIFSTFRGVVLNNQAWVIDNKGLRFCQFVFRSYTTAASLGVRRHVKNKGNAISMAKLIAQMRRCAGEVTLDFYRSKFPPDPNDVDWQARSFRRLSEDGRVVSEKILDRDVTTLRQLCLTIEGYADRVLAHLDPKGFEDTFTYDDLEQAIRNFDELVCRYEGFLTGSSPNTLEAVVQYPWERIFDVPLRKPG